MCLMPLYLGHTYFQGSDIGEILETIYRTSHSDPWSWSTEFAVTAERLETTATEFENKGTFKKVTYFVH